jgi:hypothetical protein
MAAYEYTQHRFIRSYWLLFVLSGRLENFAVSHGLQLNSITMPSSMCSRSASCDIVPFRQRQYSNRFQLLYFLGVWSCGSTCESHLAQTARNLTAIMSVFTLMNSRTGFRCTCMSFCFLVPTVVLMKWFVTKVDFVRATTCDPYCHVIRTREVGRM